MNAIERLESLTVGDIMTDTVVQVGTHHSMCEVARTMRESRVSLVPVVDDRGRALGVLSAYDFVLREAERCDNLSDSQTACDDTNASESPAGIHMTRSIQSIAAGASVLEAAQLLFSEHLHRLLVLDAKGRPQGVVSTMDVISALVNSVEEMRITQTVRAR